MFFSLFILNISIYEDHFTLATLNTNLQSTAVML